MLTADEIRSYWDADAATYDDATNHRPTSPAERAAWAGALSRLLPSAPARVLDCGAGTGFLSLLAARLGHQVTALDLSGAMLERLRERADGEGLEIDVREGSATEPPPGPFDVVMERHLLW
ncbi:MAG: class I SAM-dependent methyltransferase, partial [Acidimicrobiales bacterium]